MALHSYEEFLKVHEHLLLASGLPKSLYEKLFYKLSCEVFDAGNFFQIESLENSEHRPLEVILVAEKLSQNEDVFLIDHAWSFRYSDARKQLEENPELVDRLAKMMGIITVENTNTEKTNELEQTETERQEKMDEEEEKCKESNIEHSSNINSINEIFEKSIAHSLSNGRDVTWLELDELNIDDEILTSIQLDKKFPKLIGLSLWGNKIKNFDSIFYLLKNFHSIRALWLNNNPLEISKNHLKEKILEDFPNIEIFNSEFTKNYTQWALHFCSENFDPNYENGHFESKSFKNVFELDLSDRKISKLKKEVFNSDNLPFLEKINLRGNGFEDQKVEELISILGSLSTLKFIEIDVTEYIPEKEIFSLITLLPNIQKINNHPLKEIKQKIKVSNWLENFQNFEISELEEEYLPLRETNYKNGHEILKNDEGQNWKIETILVHLWKYVCVYRLSMDEKYDESSVWYVMDEFGTSITHSSFPNLKISPFLFLPNGNFDSAISYSIVWPIKEINRGEKCTRDYLPKIENKFQRLSRLFVWYKIPKNIFKQAYKNRQSRLENISKQSIDENLLKIENISLPRDIFSQKGKKFKIFTDIPQVYDYLKRPEFEIIENLEDADIIWISSQIDDDFIKNMKVKPSQYVNQFPQESSFVMKHNLAKTMQKAYGMRPWLLETYDMESELAEWLGSFLETEETEEDNQSENESESKNERENKKNESKRSERKKNLWISKPWNLARSLDAFVEKNKFFLLRLPETGPKIFQKYVSSPAKFNQKKFDLRFLVLVKSFKPLCAFLSHVFWARIANKTYTTEEKTLSDFETHFTVMQYIGKMNHVPTHDFVSEFEKENNVKWESIESKVKLMIIEVLKAIVHVCTNIQDDRSRAIYGFDVMLDDRYDPKLLEITYCPDCSRACNYDMHNVSGEHRGKNVLKGSQFYNDVFGCLFLDEISNVTIL